MNKQYKIEKRVSHMAQEVGTMFRQERSLRGYQQANNPKELADNGRIYDQELDGLMDGESLNRMV